jgi:hypothetical protein
VGDEERAAAVDRLAVHFRDGRIDEEELEERTAAANAARTRGDLVTLEADLPAPPPPPPDVAIQRRHRRERVISALAVPAFLWVVYCATDFGGFVWPIFPTAVFALGLVKELWGGDQHDDRRHHHGRDRDRRRDRDRSSRRR